MTTLPELLGQGGGSIPIWFSGRTVLKWDTVRSPADGELYTRIAADGAGTTDPADDITNYVAASYRRTTALAAPTAFATASGFAQAGATVVNPIIAAGARTLLISAAGRGSLTFLGAAQTSGASQVTRWEVIVDGRNILDTSLGLPNNNGTVVIGRTTMSSAGNEGFYAWEDYSPVEFRRSLAIYITPVNATTSSMRWASKIRGLS